MYGVASVVSTWGARARVPVHPGGLTRMHAAPGRTRLARSLRGGLHRASLMALAADRLAGTVATDRGRVINHTDGGRVIAREVRPCRARGQWRARWVPPRRGLRPVELPPIIAARVGPRIGKHADSCWWFLYCGEQATIEVPHPVLGRVPSCIGHYRLASGGAS